MKYLQLLLFYALLLSSCTEPQNSTPTNTSTPPVEKKSDLPPLSDAQSAQVKKIHQTFLEVFPVSYEDATNNFRRDKNPDREIKIWNHMAEIYQDFAIKHAGQDQLAIRKEAFRLLLLRSSLSEEVAIERAKSQLLSEEDAKKLLSKYTMKEKLIKVGQ